MDKIQIQSRIWLKKGGKNYLGNGRIKLLKHIQQEGSILKASKKMHMSYRSAWDNMRQIKALSKQDLIISASGGKKGGGTILTEEGKKAIRAFEALEALKDQMWKSFEGCENLDEVLERAEKYQQVFDEFLKNL